MNGLLLSLALVMGPPPQSIPNTYDSWLVHAAITASAVGQFTDLSTTMYAMGTGRFREANPLLKGFADKPVAMGLAKGLMTAGVTYGLIELHKRKPRVAFWAALGITVLQGWVTWQNAETLRR